MKTKNIVLFALATLSFLALSFQGFSQKSFLNFTLDGKEYKYTDEDVNGYYKDGDVEETDKVHYVETSGYVSILSNVADRLTFNIRTAKGTRPTVGKYIFMSSLSPTDILPNVHISLDREVNEDYTFYGSKNKNAGTFEVTKVDGDWIEGNFEITLPNSYIDKAVPVKVTNGSFRIKCTKF